MIPKIIHYCWFGGEKPHAVNKYIESWRKLCPDYEIKEWNEGNFDINCFPYVQEAYNCRRFAFVSDVARLVALFNEGGIYLDTDIELLSSLDKFLCHEAFIGFENEKYISTAVIGSVKGGAWIRECLNYYNSKHFIVDGQQVLRTNVDILTEIAKSKGLTFVQEVQNIGGILTIYPKDYFSPKSWYDGKIYKTKRTVCIHHFSASWFTDEESKRNKQRLAMVHRAQRIEHWQKRINYLKTIIKKIVRR